MAMSQSDLVADAERRTYERDPDSLKISWCVWSELDWEIPADIYEIIEIVDQQRSSREAQADMLPFCSDDSLIPIPGNSFWFNGFLDNYLINI